MDPIRWERIKRVAADAIELDPKEREAFVIRATVGDTGLATEVRRILSAHTGEDSLFDRTGPGAQSGGAVMIRPHPGEAAVESAFPAELIERGARRLGALALVYAAGLLLAYLAYEVIVHVVGAAPYEQGSHTPGQMMGAAFIALGLVVWRIAADRTWAPHHLVRLAFTFEVAGSLGIALVSYSGAWALESPVWGVSWICVWIMVFPLVIPGPSRSAAVAAFSAAGTGPVAIFVWGVTRDFTFPPTSIILATTLPNFLCATLAWLGSRYIYRIGLELRVARQMGHYRLVSRIGRGGMGEVWAAEHDMLARPAAVKLVRPELMRRSRLSSEAMLRFEREAQSTAGLSSPHTVNLYDFGVTDEDVFYYVMELLDGLDLEVLVQRHGPVPPGRAVHFLVQACHSLAEAHANGLVHRDIKPSNLFACRQGLTYDFIKVLDFGIVNPQGVSPSSAGAEGLPPVEGTPGWIAPEAAERGTSDARADLYALGCVGYWLLTGRLVFEAEEAVGLARMHREEAPAPPSRHAGGVPPEVDAVILSCLEKDPDRRPSSAVELATRLRAAAVTPWGDAEAIGWWRSVEAGTGDRPASEGSGATA